MKTCGLLSVVERKILRIVELEDLILMTRLCEFISIFSFFRFIIKNHYVSVSTKVIPILNCISSKFLLFCCKVEMKYFDLLMECN